MDKQMIEEMKKDIAVRMAMAKGVAGSMNKGVEGWLSEYLCNKGWRKIPEGAVVLTDDELNEVIYACKVSMIVIGDDGEKYISLDDHSEYTRRLGKLVRQRKARIEYLEKLLDDRCDRCIERERKETAEKLLDEIDYESNGQTKSITDLLRKKYGV